MNLQSKISATSNRTTSRRKMGVRELAAQATKESLLRAAIKIFAKNGFDGGSIEKISKAAKSHDRMIYYYFDSKSGIFLAVIEEIYRRFNEAEAALDLDIEHPISAMEEVVKFILSYYRKNPEFVTLLNEENLHRGRHLSKSLRKGEHASPAVAILDKVLLSGLSQGLFRRNISGRDLYLMIAALGYFYQSNRFTLSSFLAENLDSPEAISHWEEFCIDSIFRTVLADGQSINLQRSRSIIKQFSIEPKKKI